MRGVVGTLLCVLASHEARAQRNAAHPGMSRLDSLRFTISAVPRDERLARTLLARAVARDTFPGLPRPREHVEIVIAPDAERFREWIGPSAPEWGAAIAIPENHTIVMQGSRAGARDGDPAVTLRHELAHMALHEALGDLPPRWFDEGYASFAAGEWGRDDVLAANVALVLRGVPALDELDALFSGGEARAQRGYALAHRAIAELAGLDPARGLSLFFPYWRDSRSFEQAMRRAFGVTSTEFEHRWQTVTRRRYGALALVADLSLASVLLLVLVGPLWISRVRRDRRRLADMLAAERAQELRDRESAIAAFLAGPDAPPAPHAPRAPHAPKAPDLPNAPDAE